MWTGLLHDGPQGQCLSWREQGLDQQVSSGVAERRRLKGGAGEENPPAPGRGDSMGKGPGAEKRLFAEC